MSEIVRQLLSKAIADRTERINELLDGEQAAQKRVVDYRTAIEQVRAEVVDLEAALKVGVAHV